MKDPIISFIGADFDCVYKDSGNNNIIYRPETDRDYITRSIPRIDVEQVLADYTPILIDGFVWEALFMHSRDCNGCDDSREVFTKALESRAIDRLMTEGCDVVNIAFKGVEKGSEYEEWVIANDVPVVDI